ncbi:MAG: cryptochrome/photolyase family protein, partial [Bacteroidota bacterium]
LHDVNSLRTSSGDPYRVFTPFWKRALSELHIPEPLPAPDLESRAPSRWPASEPLEGLGLLEDAGETTSRLADNWDVSEEAGRVRLRTFIEESLLDYDDARDRPDHDGTSRLSPFLHSGFISPATVWHEIRQWVRNGAMRYAADAYLRQIGWREFAYHLLHHFPHTTAQPLRGKFRDFGWEDDEESLERWQRGETGYPFVDAGMRQLRQTGWMHNRVRMIVASFLTKDLLIPWQRGARWFWESLVDADLANNTLGWQWTAGCGADAQPFFRIFNPVSQGRRYDPDGTYVRRFVPELARMPDRHIHAPWEAPADVLSDAGVKLGTTYPQPMIDHAKARERALERYNQIR